MPRKPKRPCSFPGCPKLTDDRFCEQHQKEVNKKYEMYERDPNTRKRYGSLWQRIRKMYAADHPLCELCQENGKLTKMEHVHHKLPLSEGGTHDVSNLISLCKECHARIHSERGDRWAKKKPFNY